MHSKVRFNFLLMESLKAFREVNRNEHGSLSHTNATQYIAELILGLRPANGRRRYGVTSSLIGWVQT